jgi:hypothetical protein
LGVGDSLDIVYPLPGPLAAGSYQAQVYGAPQPSDAVVHFDLLWRPNGATEQVIASADATLQQTDDGGIPRGHYGASLPAAAVPAKCDDLLVLRIKLVSGSAAFVEIKSTLEIP